MFSVSPYKIDVFDTCPFKYKCVYIDRVADKYEKPKPYLTMGSHIHNALKDYYDLFKKGERSREALEKRLRERWTENRKGFIDKSDENRWGTKALNMVRVFEASEYSKREPELLEDYYDAVVDGEFKINGRIDRADEEDEGLHVIDYKTGKSDAERNNLQLLLYAFIVQNHARRQVTKASFWYLSDNTFHSIEPDEEDLRVVVDGVREKVKIMKAERDFKPKVNKFCKYCDFFEICPARDKIESQ